MRPTSEEHIKKDKAKPNNKPTIPEHRELPRWKMACHVEPGYTENYGAIRKRDDYAGPDGA
jgi:hypothetical protein